MVDERALEEEFGTSTGLPEKMSGTIAEGWFGRQENAEGPNANRVYLFLKLINLADMSEEDEYDEWTVRLTIGDGWEPMNGGEKVVREDGGKKQFNNSTDLGKVLNRVRGKSGGGKEGEAYHEAFDGAAEALMNKAQQIKNKDGAAAQYAEVWSGLRFYFEREEFSFKNQQGEEVFYQRLMPVKFLGADERTGAAAAAGDGKAADEVLNALQELAKQHDSHGEFVTAAMQIDGVKQDGALLAKVADDSENGIYAKART